MYVGALERHTKILHREKSEFLVRELVTIADFFSFHYIAAFFIIIASQYSKKDENVNPR